MSKTDDELHALAALAEAASFGGEFQQWTVIDGESTMDWRQTPSAESAYPNNVAFLRAASPDVVRELIAELLQLRAAVIKGTTQNIRDMKTVGEYNALYHRANDRVRQLEVLHKKALSYLQESFNSGNFEKTFDEVIVLLTADDEPQP